MERESWKEGGSIKDMLRLDTEEETERITRFLIDSILVRQRRKGAVLGLSGGIDSTVTAYLCAKALGKDRVIGLLMPERESDEDSLELGKMVAESLGIRYYVEDITRILDAAGCYGRRDEEIRRMEADYSDGWRSKLVLPSIFEGDRFNVSRLVVESPDGERKVHRPGYREYFGIVAASNFKQRTRKMMEYYYADRFNLSVMGTPNILEYQLGFFVKNGDGAADVKPIAHLYKTQVFEIGRYLGVPEEILEREPTTDTYSLPQTQDEFYFALPYREMDIALKAYNEGMGPEALSGEIGITMEQAVRVFRDIESKINATRYLHMGPAVIDSPFERN